MPIHPGLLLLPAAVLTFRGETSARARSDPSNNNSGVDLLATPALSLSLEERRFRLTLTTATSLGYLNAFDPALGQPIVSQSLAASLTRGFRRVTFTFSETGQIGRTNLRLAAFGVAPPTATPAGPQGPLPPVSGAGGVANGVLLNQTIWFAASSTVAGLSEQISQNASLNQFVRTSYTSSFGEDLGTYPSQLAAGGGLGFSIQVSARDSLSTQVFGDRIKPSSRFASYNLGVGQTWAHAFSKRVSSNVSLGVGYYFPETDDSSNRPQLYPTANVGLSFAGSPISVSVSMVPVVDQFTGRVDPRVIGAIQYAEGRNRWGWFGGASGASSLVGTRESSVVVLTANAGLSYAVSRDLSLSSGMGLGYQLAPFALIREPSWIFFGFMTLSYAPPSRLL